MPDPIRSVSSSDVSVGGPTRADQYNNLRADALLALSNFDEDDGATLSVVSFADDISRVVVGVTYSALLGNLSNLSGIQLNNFPQSLGVLAHKNFLAASEVDLTGGLLHTSSGPYAFGAIRGSGLAGWSAEQYSSQWYIGGAYNLGVGYDLDDATRVQGFHYDSALTAAAGAASVFQGSFNGSITTAANETASVVATLGLFEPVITKGSGSTITSAATLYVAEAPTEGVSNYAIFVDDGIARFDGALHVAAAQPVYFDGGVHTYLHETSDNVFACVVGGTEGWRQVSGNYLKSNLLTFINDTSNANMTLGLTINQGSNDNEIFSLKSSDVAHGVTGRAETDTFFFIQKQSSTAGGALLWSFTETDIACQLVGTYTSGNTTKTTSALAPIYINARKKSGSSDTSMGSNENLAVFANAGSVKMIIDAEGDLFADGGTSSTNMVTQYDEYENDAQLVRAHMLATGGRGLIRSYWDEFVQYNEQTLIEAGLLGAPVSEGGLTNYTGMVRLHSGAIWQHEVRLTNLMSAVEKQAEEIEGLRARLQLKEAN